MQCAFYLHYTKSLQGTWNINISFMSNMSRFVPVNYLVPNHVDCQLW